MNLGTIWVRLMEKTRGRKSRATVPLKEAESMRGTKEKEGFKGKKGSKGVKIKVHKGKMVTMCYLRT